MLLGACKFLPRELVLKSTILSNWWRILIIDHSPESWLMFMIMSFLLFLPHFQDGSWFWRRQFRQTGGGCWPFSWLMFMIMSFLLFLPHFQSIINFSGSLIWVLIGCVVFYFQVMSKYGRVKNLRLVRDIGIILWFILTLNPSLIVSFCQLFPLPALCRPILHLQIVYFCKTYEWRFFLSM